MTPATVPTAPTPAALIAAHLRQAARRWVRGGEMIADTKIVDPRGLVLARPGDALSDSILYLMELAGVKAHYQSLVDVIWYEMAIDTISPVRAEIRIARVLAEAGYTQ